MIQKYKEEEDEKDTHHIKLAYLVVAMTNAADAGDRKDRIGGTAHGVLCLLIE